MKRYLMTVDVSKVVGTRTFAVDAESPAEARALITAGEGVIVHEELKVHGLDWRGAVIEQDK